MSRSRTNEILDEWRAVANAAALPADAPRPSRHVYPFGVVAAAVAAFVVFVALWARVGMTPGVRIGASGSGPSTTSSAALVPSPTENASSSLLPSAGGTCSASQFVLGEPTSGPGYGALGTSVVFVTQPIRNGGGDCVLELPSAIGVASSDGPFQAVPVRNVDTPTSWKVKTGQSKSIVLGATWWTGVLDENGKPLFTAPPCRDPVQNVTRVEFPLAAGTIEIDLPTPWRWREVCSSPASVTVDVAD
jgi:hypothetical protein